MDIDSTFIITWPTRRDCGITKMDFDTFAQAERIAKAVNEPCQIREITIDHFTNTTIDRIRAVMA